MTICPVSYRTPTLVNPYAAGPGAGAASRRSGSPDWVMLDKTAYISDRRNASTAESQTSEGQIVQGDGFSDEPSVLAAEGSLVLFRVNLSPRPRRSGTYMSPCNYFVYTAGPGRPWLDLLPDPNAMPFNSQQFGLFPCRSGVSEHYDVAFLNSEWVASDEACQFELCTFSSKTGRWSSKPVLLDLSPSEIHKVAIEHETDKLITIGHDSLGLVDLWRGIILLEKLFDDYPVMRYMTFPKPVVYTIDAYGATVCGEIAPECARDVACCDGLIKFVDIEYCYSDDVNGNGWKATIWNRMLSWKDWRKRFSVDKFDILVDPSYSTVLPDLWDDNTKMMQLKKLICTIPTLSMYDDDFVYMMSTMTEEDKNAWIISVDMKQNTLQAVAPISAERFSVLCSDCRPCAFSKYLKITSGVVIPNPVGEYTKRNHLQDRVLEALRTQDSLNELDDCSEFERSNFEEYRSLVQSSPVSSLHSNIQNVAGYYASNDIEKAASKAVNICLRTLAQLVSGNVFLSLRASEDLNQVLQESTSYPSAHAEAIRSKINVVLRAIGSLVQTVPVQPRMTTVADSHGVSKIYSEEEKNNSHEP
uniref:Uncharacterized protein n=2 Tax=Oryza TaxID=4527 RepID=A0A0D3FEI7_9ORYZ